MARLFGTDGVRGLANGDTLTASLALDLSVSAAKVLLVHENSAGRRESGRPLALVGRDTRISGEFLGAAVVAGLASAGVDVLDLGVIPTPGIALLTRTLRADVGVMISASHNPYQDNGIKLFGPDGAKLNDSLEAAIEQLMARDLTGEFGKPRYVDFHEELCAHSRSSIVGCHRCLDLCPTGAIAPNGDHVAIDARICAGCGQCAAACPTGAAAYALPPADALLSRLRTLLAAYRQAGGREPVVLFHDGEHGTDLIDALARFGDGLPANVLPVAVNEVTQVGLEVVAAAFAYGAAAVRFLLRAKPRHDIAGLAKTIALAEPILGGLGFNGPRAATIETDDPDALGMALRTLPAMPPAVEAAQFAPVGGKREVLRLSLRELHGVAPAPRDVVPLPADAPFGAVIVDTTGCTLCLSCVSACPTGALSGDPDKPMLRFSEDACVQCGLCRATCPEKVIALQPQIDFRAATAQARVIKQEEPFACIRCGKPFGVKSTIERVAAKLEGKHWMYKDSKSRLDLIKMCDDCRVTVTTEQQFDPFGAPQRPRPRTTDDYLRNQKDIL